MKPVVVLQHVPHETLGALEPFFVTAGLSIRYVELFRELPEQLDLRQAAALVVMGGPMNVDKVDKYPFLRRDVAWLQEALEADLPILGICLGAQLLAKALGAKVYLNGVKEIGWYDLELTPAAADDLLFGGRGPTEVVFQWHGDTFDLPAGAVHLAQSKQCRHQAFRYGRSAYGFQFHAEMTAELIDNWLNEPENRCELAGLDYVDPKKIREETPRCLPQMQAFGGEVLPRFVAMCRER